MRQRMEVHQKALPTATTRPLALPGVQTIARFARLVAVLVLGFVLFDLVGGVPQWNLPQWHPTGAVRVGLYGLALVLLGWTVKDLLPLARDVATGHSLRGVAVAELMQRALCAVGPATSVEEMVQRLAGSQQHALPVVSDSAAVGVVTLHDAIRKSHPTRWATTPVSEVMTGMADAITVSPRGDAHDALKLLAEHQVDQLLVVTHGQVVGLFRREDVIQWLAALPVREKRPRARKLVARHN